VFPVTLSKYINQLANEELNKALEKCCASGRWRDQMAAARPFATDQQVLQHATDVWNSLGRDDWLEAFAAHPRIGDVESLRRKYADTREWAGAEQAGVDGANFVTLQRLADLNLAYETKFGYLFIVCATGKSAAEMLSILEDRLPNEADTEVRNAAAEQLKITLLRLDKLIP
jgi:2-oxo-4-hydroxy-4-carboxy-5-ureidoimidazoline decarboxylase